MALNPDLYASLVTATNRGVLPGREVRISNPNQPMSARYEKDPLTGKTKLKVIYAGESYLICCPFCGDNRYRLSLSHRWGVLDEKTGTRNWWLAHCYNEGCESDPDFFGYMRDRLNPFTLNSKPQVAPVNTTAPAMGPQPVAMPEGCTPLHDLGDDHPAAQFLIGRGYNHRKLGREFHVQFCPASRHPLINHRLVFPFIQGDKLVGWQARYVDAKGTGDCGDLYYCENPMCHHMWRASPKPAACPGCSGWLIDRVPKWFTGPGTLKSLVLFNYDKALEWPFVVLVEGPLDVCRLGNPLSPDVPGPGVASMGHSLSLQQKQLLHSRWMRGAVVLLYDQDVWANPKEALKLEWMYREFQANFAGGAVKVVLPEDCDPGDMTHDDLWATILNDADSQGVDLQLVPRVTETDLGVCE